MDLFTEVKTLHRISREAFDTHAQIFSHIDKTSNDILVLCATSKHADEVFNGLVKDMLGCEISKASRRIRYGLCDLYVRQIGRVEDWLRGRRFKEIYFEE